MSISASAFSAGYTGSRVLANTSPLTGRYRGFVVNTDAVVSAILDKSGTSLMSTINLTGITLKQGIYICVPDDNYISSITLASGSIVLYNE